VAVGVARHLEGTLLPSQLGERVEDVELGDAIRDGLDGGVEEVRRANGATHNSSWRQGTQQQLEARFAVALRTPSVSSHLGHDVEQVAGVVQEGVRGSGGEGVHNVTVDLVVAGVNVRFSLQERVR